MFDRLSAEGFDIAICNHAGAILSVDFPTIPSEIEDALMEMKIPIHELIGSGGGEAPSTQRLRNRLNDIGWRKHSFDFRLIVDGKETVSNSHEIDHVRWSENGVIALEIEWNNKDPFFDRDLENFQRLHAQSAISAGILITRGAGIHDRLPDIVRRTIERQGITNEQEMVAKFGMKPRTIRQRDTVQGAMKSGNSFSEAFSKQFVADKFGAATTHWSKLMDRINRGVGNPCPLLLVGLPASIIDEQSLGGGHGT